MIEFTGKCSRIVLTVLFVLVTVSGHGIAGEQDLKDYSFEDLTSMGLSNAPKTVTATTAAKVSQTTAQSPSVVRIVTAEDIRTYGYRTFDDILRSLPGLYTTNDGVNTYLGVRGLGRPGDYNTRVLILIDGVRVNDNIFDSALVGREFPLDVDLIERVEYAPGPGSAVYGKNAFFGVINVITKNANRYDGIELSAGFGTFNTKKIRLTSGKRFSNGAEVVFSVTDVENRDVSPALFKRLEPFDSDFEENRTFFGKFSYGSFKTEIVYGERNNGLHVFPDSRLVNAYDTFNDRKLLIDTRYSTHFGSDWAFEMSGTYNHASLKGTFPFREADQRIVEVDEDIGSWLTGELRAVNTHFQDHRILFGIEGHRDLRLESESYEKGHEPYFHMEDRYNSYGIYIQDDITLTDSLTLLLGGRYDATELGDRFNPRIGIIWQPREESTFKLLYGSAFRTANFFEAGVNLDVATYEEGIEIDVPVLETIETLEFAAEHYLTPTLKLTGSLYYYHLKDIIEEHYDIATDIFSFRNGQPIDAVGFEFTAEKRFESGVITDVSCIIQKTEDSEGHRLSNSPAHQIKLRSSIPLWFDNGRLGAEAYYTGDRKTEEGSTLDAFWLANLTLTYGVNSVIDFSAGIQNIGGTRYYDPARALILAEDGVEQRGRSFYFQVDFKF